MNEVAKLVSEKTGLPPEVSTMVVDVVFNFIKGKLPPEIASELDKVAGAPAGTPAQAVPGADATGGLLGKVEGMLGGMFGGGKTN